MLGVECLFVDLLIKEVQVVYDLGICSLVLFLVIFMEVKLLCVSEVFNFNGIV